MSDTVGKQPAAEAAIRVVMMPRDTNAANTIFGGVLLSYIDQAGFAEARRQATHRYVTVAFREVEFRAPVFVGDVLSLYAKTTRIGRTSLTIAVRVCSRRREDPDQVAHVTEAEVVVVATDEQNKPTPIFPD